MSAGETFCRRFADRLVCAAVGLVSRQGPTWWHCATAVDGTAQVTANSRFRRPMAGHPGIGDAWPACWHADCRPGRTAKRAPIGRPKGPTITGRLAWRGSSCDCWHQPRRSEQPHLMWHRPFADPAWFVGLARSRAKARCGSVQTKAGDERRRLILEHARGNGRIEVAEIAIQLDVATETVRRDLKVLEDHGLVRRTHGGAYPTDGAGFETSMGHRSGHRVPEKRRIAVAAAENVGDAETIYLDEGFTPQLVADELITLQRPLTVVTASLAAAGLLAPVRSMSVILLGGRVRGRTLGTVDYWATNMLSDLVIDLAILGTNGISRERGLTTPDPAVSAVKHKVVLVSRRRLFVGIHTKFGTNSFCKFADVADSVDQRRRWRGHVRHVRTRRLRGPLLAALRGSPQFADTVVHAVHAASPEHGAQPMPGARECGRCHGKPRPHHPALAGPSRSRGVSVAEHRDRGGQCRAPACPMV